MVGFVLRNTLSEYGSVARGVCEHDGAMYLRRVLEYPKIEKAGDGARQVGGNDGGRIFTGDEMVSMNLWGFQPSVFARLESRFEEFLESRGEDPKAEFYLSTEVDRMVSCGEACVKILPTRDDWFGVTYREDHAVAVAKVRDLIQRGVYPARLWDEK